MAVSVVYRCDTKRSASYTYKRRRKYSCRSDGSGKVQCKPKAHAYFKAQCKARLQAQLQHTQSKMQLQVALVAGADQTALASCCTSYKSQLQGAAYNARV